MNFIKHGDVIRIKDEDGLWLVLNVNEQDIIYNEYFKETVKLPGLFACSQLQEGKDDLFNVNNFHEIRTIEPENCIVIGNINKTNHKTKLVVFFETIFPKELINLFK